MKRLACVAIVACAACAPAAPPPPGPGLVRLRQEHERLHERLRSLVANDPLLAEGVRDPGQVAVALRTALVKSVFQEVAQRYLDRVALDVVRDIPVHEKGEIKTKTFLGTLRAGEWALDLTIHRIQGLVRARSPRADFVEGNRVRLAVGIVLEQARGEATLRFRWDSAGVANVVCKDFEVTQRLIGLVLPDEYPVSGSFTLTAAADTLLARPEFPDRPFRLRIDLTPESWAQVRKALEEQDTLMKCSIGIDPDAILPKLKELARRGFDLRLPRTLFRPVELPASLEPSVAVEDRQVSLSVKPSALKLSADALWMSAAIKSQVTAQREASPPTSPTSTPGGER